MKENNLITFKTVANRHTKEQLIKMINNQIERGRKDFENFDSIENQYIQKALNEDLSKMTKIQLAELKLNLFKALMDLAD